MSNKLTTNGLLFQFLNTFFKRKYMFIISFLIAFFTTVFGVFLMEPQYNGVSNVIINGKQSVIEVRANDVSAQAPPTSSVMNTMVGIMESQTFMENVAKRTDYVDIYKEDILHPDLRGKIKGSIFDLLSSPVYAAQALGILQDEEPDYQRLAVENLSEKLMEIMWNPESQIITITVVADDPLLSNKLSTAAVEEFLANGKELSRAKYKNLKVSIESAHKKASEDLRLRDNALYDFKKYNNVSQVSDTRQNTLQNIADLEAQALRIDSQIKKLEGELSSIHTQKADIDGTVTSKIENQSTASLDSDPIIQELISDLSNLQLELDKLDGGEEISAQIILLQGQIDQIEMDLEDRTMTVLSSESSTHENPLIQDLDQQEIQLNAEILGLNAESATVSLQVKSLQESVGPMSDLEKELTTLTREQSIALSQYSDLSNDLQQVTELLDDPVSDLDFQVLERSHLNERAKADFPSWPLVIVIALFSAYILALFCIFLIEYWNDSFIEEQELSQRYDGVQVLGSIKRIK